jgi:hypothetical protein
MDAKMHGAACWALRPSVDIDADFGRGGRDVWPGCQTWSMRRSLPAIALALVLIAAVVAPALAAPQLAPGTINLSGTPTGSGTLEKDIAANFFLTKRVLGKQVHVTIGGHNATVRHVGASTKFYVGKLPSSVKLHFGKRYRVVIRACDKTGCSRTVRDKTLPKPSL